MPKEIFFIRHGQAQHNVDEVIYGDDAYFFPKNRFSHLTEEGQYQASSVTRPEVDQVICSSLPRTLETAHLIFQSTDIPIHVHDEVRESNYQHPCNERWSRDTIAEIYPHFNVKTLTNGEDCWYPSGDTDYRNSLLDELIRSSPHERIAVVSHREFIGLYLESKGIFDIDLRNCEIYRYRWEGGNPQFPQSQPLKCSTS